MFDQCQLISRFKIDVASLVRFLLTVHINYNDKPFHNWLHAWSVMHACWMMITAPDGELYLEHVYARMTMGECPWANVHVRMSMCECPCPCANVHVRMSMCECPCPCANVHVHVRMYMCECPCPCANVHVRMLMCESHRQRRFSVYLKMFDMTARGAMCTWLLR